MDECSKSFWLSLSNFNFIMHRWVSRKNRYVLRKCLLRERHIYTRFTFCERVVSKNWLTCTSILIRTSIFWCSYMTHQMFLVSICMYEKKLWDRHEHMCKLSQRALKALSFCNHERALQLFGIGRNFPNNFICLQKTLTFAACIEIKSFKRCAFDSWSRFDIYASTSSWRRQN